MENHRGVIRSLHFFHARIKSEAGADDSLGRKDDLFVSGLDILRSQNAPVVEFHRLADLEGVGPLVLGDRPALGQVPDHLGVVIFVKFEQKAVVGGDGVDQAKGVLPVAVIGRGFSSNGEDQGSAPLGLLFR